MIAESYSPKDMVRYSRKACGDATAQFNVNGVRLLHQSVYKFTSQERYTTSWQ